MKKLIQLLVLTFLLTFSVSVKANIKWIPISSPPFCTQIIGGESTQNFWLLNKENTLIHFDHGKWTSYPIHLLFKDYSTRKYHPVRIGKEKLFVLLTDLKWETHIAELSEGKIIQYDFASPTPLHTITKVLDDYYATGDFGLVYKKTKDKWVELDSPIKTHIISVNSDSKGNLWLGTKGEGAFLLKNDTITSIAISKEFNTSTVAGIRFIKDSVYFRVSNTKVYKLYKSEFTAVDFNSSPFVNNIQLMSKGYYTITSERNKIRSIPFSYKISSYKELENGKALLLTEESKLYYDEEFDGNFFLNHTASAGLEGPKYSFEEFNLTSIDGPNLFYARIRPGIILSDFNKDYYNDILFFNISDKRRPYLYINNKGGYFTDFADPLGLNNLPFTSYFSYAFDLNGDLNEEIISPNFLDGVNKLSVYEKIAGSYQNSFTYTIPDEYNIEPIQQLSISDINNDGALDIALVFGYSQNGKGNLLFLKNNGYGEFKPMKNQNDTIFTGWNVKALFADFNNDDLNDILLIRNWGTNVIYYRDKDDEWNPYELEKTDPKHPQRHGDAVSFDFDNDGDLDLFTLGENPFITLYKNDGKGNFNDITSKTNLNHLNDSEKVGRITSGDFDNNGFIDLFISSSTKEGVKNYIYLNNSKGDFIDESEALEISKEQLTFAATGDLDNDGDLDLYGFKKGNNILWVNNLNNSNFLRINLKGVKSNIEGLGAKVWVYETGHINDSLFLRGYRQLGSSLFGLDHQNETTLHFGVDSKKKYDIIVKFQGGKKKTLLEVETGKTINVYELGQPWPTIYYIDNKVVMLLKNAEFQSYFRIIIFGLFAMFLSCFYGYRKFQWNFPLLNLIVSINIVVFTILLTSLSSSSHFIKYYIPLIIIILGSIGPLGFFYWIKHRVVLKTQKQLNFELFQSLINFTHGAWALSNLNSIQLFFENLSVEEIHDEEYSLPFDKRKQTFIELTFPIISQITEIAKDLTLSNELIQEIDKAKNRLRIILKNDLILIDKQMKDSITESIKKLKESLSGLNKIVLSNYTCRPTLVIANLQNELEPILQKNAITFKLISFLKEDDTVLIESLELASILDNCIQNSIKAMRKTEHKEITIKLIKADTRHYIEIIDNGKGIPEKDIEKIFENGHSTNDSSGFGLYYCRETLSKYGGNIQVKQSVPNLNTTFSIELQKGSRHETININH